MVMMQVFFVDATNENYRRELAIHQMQYTQARLIFRSLYYLDEQSLDKRDTLSLTLLRVF